jgi:hypothetical protein
MRYPQTIAVLVFYGVAAHAQSYQHYPLHSVGGVSQSQGYKHAALSQPIASGIVTGESYKHSVGGLTQILRLMHSMSPVDTIDTDDVSVDYSLNSGWNLVSFPMQFEGNSIDVVRAEIPEAESLWTWNDGHWSSNIAGTPAFLNSLQDLAAGKGYYVLLPDGESKTVQLSGEPSQETVQLDQGWNLIGVAEQVTDIQTFLTTNGAQSIWSYNNNGWVGFISGESDVVNNLNAPLELGAGYFVNVPE